MTDLITKLETAESGSRELSDEVLLALGWKRLSREEMNRNPGTRDNLRGCGLLPGDWRTPDGSPFGPNKGRDSAPSPTQSVDHALGLVPPLADDMGIKCAYGYCVAWIDGEDGPRAKTPALALSAALLRAQNKE